MLLLSYLLFLLVSYFLVLQIFRLTTYHRYFFRALPLLLVYSVLVGYAMYSIRPFHGFWLTQIWASALLFAVSGWRQARRFRGFVDVAADDPRDRATLHLSGASTTAYYTLSAVTYLVTYVVSFLVFVNVLAEAP